jgi:hypothetical protein
LTRQEPGKFGSTMPRYITIYVELIDGRAFSVPLDWFLELLGASADQRRRWALGDQGRQLSWQFGLLASVTGLLAGRAGQRYAIAFSTAETVRRTRERRMAVASVEDLPNDQISPLC